MKSKIVFTGLTLMLYMSVVAQDKKRDNGFIFLLGPSITYQLPIGDDLGEYDEGRISWQMDGQIGFISTRKQTNRGNMLLAFGSVGSANNTMLQDIMEASVHAQKPIAERNFNPYYTLEGGMIILKLLRLSGGVGRQFYAIADTEVESNLMFYVGTVGLNFDFGAINLGVNTTVLSGGDLEKSIIRFSTGFLVKF